MSQTSAQSRQALVEQFAQAVSAHEVKNLDRFLENDVQKTNNSKVIYRNLQEAEEYYKKEQQTKSPTQWKVEKFDNDDVKGNTSHAEVCHDNNKQKVTYTFGSSGKIQRIDIA